jgi:DNA-binding MarR family transcriptional regulator
VKTPSAPAMSPENAVVEILRATGLLIRRVRAESNPREHTWSESTILARLEEVGWMTTADIARREAVKPQSIGASLAVLEQEGFVTRRPHPTDGRQVLFGLTEKGAETRRQNVFLKRQWFATAMAKLNPDERRTLTAAAALFKRLAES